MSSDGTDPKRMKRLRRWNAFSAYDGDSMITEGGGQNRFLAGDAAEVGDPGSDASRRAVEHVMDNGGEVVDSGRDGYFGRDLVDVRDDQGGLAKDMVRRGLNVPGAGETHLPLRETATQIMDGERTRPELDEFVAEGRADEMDFYRKRFDEVVRNTGTTTLPEEESSAFGRGVDNMQASLYGMSEIIGRATGSDPIQEFGEAGMVNNMLAAARNPAQVASYEDIDGLETFGMYAYETLAENAPQLIGDVAAGLVSGGVGTIASAGSRRLAMAGIGKAMLRRTGGARATAAADEIGKAGMRQRTGLVRGALESRSGKMGMGASIEGQLVGETRRQQYAQGLEEEDGALAHAVGTGTVKAGLEYAGFQKILGNVFKGADNNSQRMVSGLLRGSRDMKGFWKNLGRVGQLSANSSLAEGTTELGQTLIDQFSFAGLDPDRDMGLDNIDPKELLDSSLRGVVFGGGATLPGAGANALADHMRSVREGQNERALIDDQIPETEDNLTAQAEVKDQVWVSRNQSPEVTQKLRETMGKQGVVAEREGEDGTLLSRRANDELINSDEPLNRARFLESRGQSAPENLTQGAIGTLALKDVDGRRIEERPVDDDSLEQVKETLNTRLKELGLRGGRVDLEHPSDTAAARSNVESQASSEQQQDTDGEQPAPARAPEPGITLSREVSGQDTTSEADTSAAQQPPQTEQQQQPPAQKPPQTEQQTEQQAEPEAEIPPDPQPEVEVGSEVLPEPEQPVSPDEGGLRSVRDETGALRKPGEIMADYHNGRIDPDELAREAKALGIDMGRFRQGKQAPMDETRTRNKLRKLLQQDMSRARKISGWATGGTRYEVADAAIAELDSRESPMQAYLDTLRDEFGGATAVRRQKLKQDESVSTDAEGNPKRLKAGRVENEEIDNAARKQLVSRIKTKVAGATDGRLRALQRTLFPHTIPDSATKSDRERAFENFKVFFEADNALLTEEVVDSDLLNLGDELGVEGMDELLETRRVEDFNLSGLVREMQDRSQNSRRVQQRQKAQEDREVLGQASREYAGLDRVPPMRLALDHLGFLYRGDGTEISVNELIEHYGGLATAERALADATQGMLTVVPEAFQDANDALTAAGYDAVANRKGPDAQRQRLQMMVDAWHQTLAQAAQENLSLQQAPGMESVVEAVENYLENESSQDADAIRNLAPDGWQDQSADMQLIIVAASQDFNTMGVLLERLLDHPAFAEVIAGTDAEMSTEALQRKYMDKLREIHGTEKLPSTVTERLAKNIRQVEGLRTQGSKIIQRQLDRWIESSTAHTIEGFDAQLDEFGYEMAGIVAATPTDSSAAIINALFQFGMVGPGAAFADAQYLNDTVMDTPDKESAKAKPSVGQQSLGEDASTPQVLSEQQLSDIIFKKVLNSASMRFRKYNYFQGGPSQPKVIWQPGEPRRYVPKHGGNPASAHPDNKPLRETHDVFVLDFETYYDSNYNLESMGQDYQAYVNDERFAATMMSVRDPNTGEVQVLEGQDIVDYLESFKQRPKGSKEVAFVAHNGAFDSAVASKLTDFQPGLWLDTMQLTGQLEQYEGGSLKLDAIGRRFNLRNRKQGAEALEDAMGVLDISAMDQQKLELFRDYAKQDTASAGELFDIIEEATPRSALEINSLQTRIAGNPSLVKEQPELVQQLADSHQPGMVAKSGISERNSSQVGASRRNTLHAGGANLIPVPVVQSIGEGENQREMREVNFVDAVRLAEHHTSGEQQPASPIAALVNLEANLARLAQGSESDINWQLKATELTSVSDSTVIWFNNGEPVTAGEARELRNQIKDTEAMVIHQQQVKEAANARQIEMDEQIETALEGLETYYERIGSKDVVEAIRLFKRNDWGNPKALEKQLVRLRRRLQEVLAQRSQVFQGGVLQTNDPRKALNNLAGLLEAVRDGNTERLTSQGRALFNSPRRTKAGPRKKQQDELASLNETQARLQKQINDAALELKALGSAKERLRQMSQFVDSDGRSQQLRLPSGANATLNDLLSARFAVMARRKRASDFIKRNANTVETSQSGREAEGRVPAYLTGQSEEQSTLKTTVTDFDGTARNPADDGGVDHSEELSSAEAEARDKEEGNKRGTETSEQPRDDFTADVITDEEGNEITTRDTLEYQIGTNQPIESGPLFNDYDPSTPLSLNNTRKGEPLHDGQTRSRQELREERRAQQGRQAQERQEAENRLAKRQGREPRQVSGIVDGPAPTGGRAQPQQSEFTPSNRSTRPRRNKPGEVRRLGKAGQNQDFQALERLAKRLLGVFAGKNDNSTIDKTPVTIIQTGDVQGLNEARATFAETDSQDRMIQQLSDQPGYLNLNGQVIISMDPKRGDGGTGRWMMTFAHELGHMIYDQSWQQADNNTREQIVGVFLEDIGVESIRDAEYGGRIREQAFKEWFADQMGTHLAEFTSNRVSAARRFRSKEGFGQKFRDFFNMMLNRLRATWDLIQKGEASPDLARFAKNEQFTGFANSILSGQIPMRHRWDTTPEVLHFTPETATARPAPKQGVVANANQAVKNPAKFRPIAMWRSSIGRIKSHSERLAGMLFQQSQTKQIGKGSYENKRFTMEGRWAQWFEKALDASGGKVLGRKGVMNQAYTDLRDGVDSQGARELRKLIDNVLADAKKDGWRDPGLGENFVPVVFDHSTLQAKRGELIQRAKEQMPDTDETELNEIVDRIINGSGLAEFSTTDMTGPGNAVGMHRSAKQLIEVVGQDWLQENGLLLDEGAGAIRHMIGGLAKRAAWESTFGKDVLDTREMDAEQAELARQRYANTGEGRTRYDPSGTYRELVDQVRREKGEQAAAEIEDLVNGAVGNKNAMIGSKLRKTQENIIGATSLMILGFSGVATISELGLAMARANMGISDVMRSLSSYGEMRRLAKDMGIVMTTGAEEMQRLTAGEGYQSGFMAKLQSGFFTLNLQNTITKFSRTMSTAIGARFVLTAAADGDHASLRRLGLDAATVKRWEQAGRPGFSPELEGQQATDARKMNEALMQFVNESSLHPSKFQATGWGNNPYFKIAWYLKQFLWTFGDTIIGGLYRNTKNQYGEARAQGYDRGMAGAMAMMPATMAAAYTAPLALLSLGLRGALAGDDRFEEEPEKLTYEVMRKSGAFAQWDLVAGMWDAYEWDDPSDSYAQRGAQYAGAFAPPIGQADRLVHFKDDSWELDLEKSRKALKESVPLKNQWKGTWQWLYD